MKSHWLRAGGLALGLVGILVVVGSLGAWLHLWALPGTPPALPSASGLGVRLPAAAVAALPADGMAPVNGAPAKPFTLVDQGGARVSLGDLKGRAVVLTFLDPVCWYECTLQSLDMKLMLRYLSPDLRNRVALVAVAANPIVHSVASVAAFTREQGLASVPGWYFLTSPSLTKLKAVWREYGVKVPTPSYQMADHPEIFELIDPSGRLRYVMGPADTPGSFLGTAEILAAYTAALVGGHAVFGHGAASGTGLLAKAPFLAPLAERSPLLPAHMTSAEDGWRMAWNKSLGEYVLQTTANAGAAWKTSPLPGIDGHGGILAAFGDSGKAWIVVLPFGYDHALATFYTSDGGARWSSTGVLPTNALSVSSARKQVLSGTPNIIRASDDAAYLVGRHALWSATGAGSWRRLASLPPGVVAGAELHMGPTGAPVVTSGGKSWTWEAGAWRRSS